VHPRIVEPEQIIFFDDAELNISNANAIGVNAHVTAPFTREHEPLIYKHLGIAM
jgi:hypothetical protein